MTLYKYEHMFYYRLDEKTPLGRMVFRLDII